MKNRRKKVLSFIVALLLVISPQKTKEDKKGKGFIATYSKGNIYIGDNAFFENVLEYNNDDVFILDIRDQIDPNMRIISSYLITDAILQQEILNILLEYEKLYPSNWNRTLESMNIEWIIHNTLYYLNYEKNRTQDVDLNNLDEEKYKVLVK